MYILGPGGAGAAGVLRHRFTSLLPAVCPCFPRPFFRPCSNICPGTLAAHRGPRRPGGQRPGPAVLARVLCLAALAFPARWRHVVRVIFVCGWLGGALRDLAGGPVEFATITLHRAADFAVVKSEFSDATGAFALRAPAGARYRVSTAQVSYVRYWSAPFALPAAGLVLPMVALRTRAATALREVVGQKPLFEHLAERTVVNVENSPLAAGDTALDVLARAPGVSVDGSDNLALRGRQGLLVLIDGKRQPMTSPELADYLLTLPAEQLKCIELITNPPTSYDAQGTAGVIAINLEKDQRQGTNGSANLGYGRGVYGRLTTGATLNYRRGKATVMVPIPTPTATPTCA